MYVGGKELVVSNNIYVKCSLVALWPAVWLSKVCNSTVSSQLSHHSHRPMLVTAFYVRLTNSVPFKYIKMFLNIHQDIPTIFR